MSGIIQQAEYGEGRGTLVCINVAMGVLVTALLYASHITPPAVGLPTSSIQDHGLQMNRQEESISRGTPGRRFIYSLEPWGGVRGDEAERPLFAMWDVSILPSRSGVDLLSTNAHMRRGDIRRSTQFLRLRNLNWITTS
ncbi:hypothetical protein [Candidatus Nitrospira neomarina]|uniref:Uncharacterized protein n=1 Tax=Candidatus Nitrospira neomarina TaxID=3020899 RepID=A0AA96GKH2_9BACT|nr:hypothetical protein [Candidatus Nitrospira neomarina]WNM62657.1 hypothetical protein PQG83_02620 [Candidatus Nitrospira neomarina]